MASHQGAVKHGFVSKIAGICSFYDVIADLVNFLLPKVAQGVPHKVPENPATLHAAVFSLSAKNLRGGGGTNPLAGRGLNYSFRLLTSIWHRDRLA